MRQRWTDEMQADLERWEASNVEAWSPDFMIPTRANLNDILIGLVRYAVAAIRYWAVGGWKPSTIRQQVESANIERQLGPERLAENKAFLEQEPFDFFDDADCFDA